MRTTNSLSVLTAQLNPVGQQRLFEFLDAVDTDTAARFRGWLGTASELQVTAAAESLSRVSHGREFAAWWRQHAPGTAPLSAAEGAQLISPARTRAPREHLHSQVDAQRADRDVTVGGALLTIGLLVTLGSYFLAVNSPGGGHYVIATGAILFGTIRLIRGLSSRR